MRARDGNGTWDVRTVQDLNEAAGLLSAGDDIVLGLPVNAILAQRLRLPTVDPAEFGEMVRMQVEKSLPYPPEEVTSDYEVIEQGETDSVISAVAVHNQQLNELAGPLFRRGHIPRQVTVYAAQRAASHAASGRALFIYREGEKLVSAISENGKLSFTRTLRTRAPEQLATRSAADGAERGVAGNQHFLPQRLARSRIACPLRDTIERIFAQRPELIGAETPPAAVKLDLAPASWRSNAPHSLGRRSGSAGCSSPEPPTPRFFCSSRSTFWSFHFQVGHVKNAIERDQPRGRFHQGDGGGLEGARARDRSSLLPDRDACSIFSKACLIRMCGSRFTISPRGIFRCRAKRPRPRSPISLPKR